MQKNKQTVINMIAQILGFSINMGISFFLTSFIINNIGKEIYGFLGLANNFVGYIAVFTVALNSMLSRYVAVKVHNNDLESANKYFSSVAIANFVISLILIVPSTIFILFLDEFINVPGSSIMEVKLLWFFIFLGFFINVSSNVFNVATFLKNRLDLAALVNVNSNIIRALLLILFFGLLNPNLWYVGLVTLICSLYVFLANYRITKKITPELKIKKRYFNWNSMKELLTVGIWNSVNQLNQIFMTGMNLLITNIFIGAVDMSLLAIAVTIPLQIQSFIQTVATTFTPQLTLEYVKNSIKDFVQQVKFSMKITGFLTTVPIIGLIIYGADFFSLWLPSLEINEITKVHILSILILLPMIFNAMLNPLFNVNIITAKVKIPVITNSIIGVLNIVFVFLFIYYTNFGVYAVVGVSAVMQTFRMIIFVPLYTTYILKVKWYTFYMVLIRGLLAMSIISMTFMLIKQTSQQDSWVSLGLTCLLSGIIGYTLNFLIFFNKKERLSFIRMIKK